jgi:hypothetical protein
MPLPVHLQRSTVAAIVDCPVRAQFIGSRSLEPVALQSICLFQESPDTPAGRLGDPVEPTKAHYHSKGEHPFRVIKQQFDF